MGKKTKDLLKATKGTTPKDVESFKKTVVDAVVDAVNEHRRAKGLPPLPPS